VKTCNSCDTEVNAGVKMCRRYSLCEDMGRVNRLQLVQKVHRVCVACSSLSLSTDAGDVFCIFMLSQHTSTDLLFGGVMWRFGS